jgi:hypothetical protein
VWCSNGSTLDWLDADGVRLRGEEVEETGQPPLLRLCRWARGEDVDLVEALAFGVFPPRGN